MKQRRAFTGEWMPRFAVCVLDITVWGVVLARVSGLSEPISFGLLTFLAFAFTVLCGVVGERDPHKAWVLGNIFLAAPAVLLVLLVLLGIGLVLWRKLF